MTLIADNKGMPPAEGVIAGALLGVIGWLILAVQPNRKQSQPAYMPPVATQTYRGSTRESAEAAYHVDARSAAQRGYVPVSEHWSTALGEQLLTVTYQYNPAEVPRVMGMLH